MVAADGSAITPLNYSPTGRFLTGGYAYADFDQDNDVDGADYILFQACMSGSGNKPPLSCTPGGPPPAGNFGLHGRPIDVFTDPGGNRHALLFVRARHYDLTNGRWLQRDPMGYVDGPNLYEAFGGNPLANRDPSGEYYKLWSTWQNGAAVYWQEILPIGWWCTGKPSQEINLGNYYCDGKQKFVVRRGSTADDLENPDLYLIPFEAIDQRSNTGWSSSGYDRFVYENGIAIRRSGDGKLEVIRRDLGEDLRRGLMVAQDEASRRNREMLANYAESMLGARTIEMVMSGGVDPVTDRNMTGDEVRVHLLNVAAMATGAGGTMASVGIRAGLSVGRGGVMSRVMRVAQSDAFRANARFAGFNEAEIAAVRSRLLAYSQSGQVRGTLSPVSRITADGIRISYYGGKGHILHELGHLLDDIAHPGLLGAEKSLTYSQIVAAERTASIVQLGARNWRTTVVPHLAALDAKTGLVSTCTWGLVGVAAYRAYDFYGGR